MMYTYRACAADRESRTYIDPCMVYVLGSEYRKNGDGKDETCSTQQK